MDKGWPGCALPNLFWRLWKPRPIVVLRVVDRGLLAVADLPLSFSSTRS